MKPSGAESAFAELESSVDKLKSTPKKSPDKAQDLVGKIADDIVNRAIAYSNANPQADLEAVFRDSEQITFKNLAAANISLNQQERSLVSQLINGFRQHLVDSRANSQNTPASKPKLTPAEQAFQVAEKQISSLTDLQKNLNNAVRAGNIEAADGFLRQIAQTHISDMIAGLSEGQFTNFPLTINGQLFPFQAKLDGQNVVVRLANKTKSFAFSRAEIAT